MKKSELVDFWEKNDLTVHLVGIWRGYRELEENYSSHFFWEVNVGCWVLLKQLKFLPWGQVMKVSSTKLLYQMLPEYIYNCTRKELSYWSITCLLIRRYTLKWGISLQELRAQVTCYCDNKSWGIALEPRNVTLVKIDVTSKLTNKLPGSSIFPEIEQTKYEEFKLFGDY